MGNAYSILLNN